jgi:hypothetical protein
MKARIALVGAIATVLATVAAPTAAMAGPNDNNNASVGGVTPINAPSDPSDGCPEGNFCLYTGAGYTGKVFRLYHCQTYSLADWNGIGSYWNHNTGGAHGYIQNQNHGTITDASAYPGNNSWAHDYNFTPAWYVKAC